MAIHLYCKVLSDKGFPSRSGYTISFGTRTRGDVEALIGGYLRPRSKALKETGFPFPS